MKRPKRCTSAACQGTLLVKSAIESSLSIERYDCPRCGKPYTCPTALASTTQVASTASAFAIAGTFLWHVWTSDWESAAEHAAENIERLLG